MEIRYDREVLLEVLIYHQHTESSACICGWNRLGYSHPEHVREVYEESMRVREK